jgi:peptide chain release factor
VETGVRATYIPTGLSVAATEERSQGLNKQAAIKRLKGAWSKLSKVQRKEVEAQNRLKHSQLVRGNPVRVYCGIGFKRLR